jgi:glutaredoxin 3
MAKTFLREKNIPFQEIDVGRDRKAAKEMVTKSGQMGVPVIEIDGKIIVGYDREALSREL